MNLDLIPFILLNRTNLQSNLYDSKAKCKKFKLLTIIDSAWIAAPLIL